MAKHELPPEGEFRTLEARDIAALAARFCAGERGRKVTIHLNTEQEPGLGRVTQILPSSTWEQPWLSTWNALLQHANIPEEDRESLRKALQETIAIPEEDQRQVPLLAALLAESIGDWAMSWRQALPGWWRPAPAICTIIRPLHTISIEIDGASNHEETLQDALVRVLTQCGEEGQRLAEMSAQDELGNLFLPAPDAPVVMLGTLDIDGQLIGVEGPDPFTCKALRRIALAVWRDRASSGQLRTQRVGALPLLVTRALIEGPCGPVLLRPKPMFSDGHVFLDRGSDRGVTVEIHTEGLHQGALVEVKAVEALIHRGVKEMNTIRPLKLIPWLVASVQQREREEVPLVVEGGGAGLALVMGEDPDKHGPAYRALAHLLSRLYLHTPTGIYQLYSLAEERADGGPRRKRGSLTFFPGQPLLSGRTRSALNQGESRALVPLPLDLPPLGGSPNSRAARGRMWWAILVELRKQAEEIAKSRGAFLPDSLLSELAATVELPDSQIEPTVKTLLETDSLCRVEQDRYDLGNRYPEHRKMLLEGGKMAIAGREAGLTSQARKRGRLLGE